MTQNHHKQTIQMHSNPNHQHNINYDHVNHNFIFSENKNIIIRLFQSIFSFVAQYHHYHLWSLLIILYLSSFTVTNAQRTYETAATKEDIEYLIYSGKAERGEYCHKPSINCDYGVLGTAKPADNERGICDS